MFGIGLPELLIILAVALIVVGPEKLPELAKTLAKTLTQLKHGAEELKQEFKEKTNSQELLEEMSTTFQETMRELPQNKITEELGNSKIRSPQINDPHQKDPVVENAPERKDKADSAEDIG